MLGQKLLDKAYSPKQEVLASLTNNQKALGLLGPKSLWGQAPRHSGCSHHGPLHALSAGHTLHKYRLLYSVQALAIGP